MIKVELLGVVRIMVFEEMDRFVYLKFSLLKRRFAWAQIWQRLFQERQLRELQPHGNAARLPCYILFPGASG